MFKGIFGIYTLPENIFLSGSKMKKKTNLSQNCPKWLFVTFAILIVDGSNKNDCKLDDTLRNFEYKCIYLTNVWNLSDRKALGQ